MTAHGVRRTRGRGNGMKEKVESFIPPGRLTAQRSPHEAGPTFNPPTMALDSVAAEPPTPEPTP